MHGGDGVQPHAAEDAGEAEEVLILAPAGGSPLEHLHSKFVHTRLEIGSQIECVCGEAVLGVTHIRPVQPKSHAAFHTLELDVDGLALHGFRQFKVFHIACHRIEPLRDLARLYLFTAIPRVLNIRVLGNVVALHLDVCRNMNVIPAAAIVIRLFKAGDGTGVVLCVGEFPDAVQLQRQRRGACPIFFAGSVSTETCMSIQHVFLEKGGVFYFCKIKCSHIVPHLPYYVIEKIPSSSPRGDGDSSGGTGDEGEKVDGGKVENYFTAPVIPSANCFCRTKNTIMVGMEQNRTPIINIP